MAYKHTALGLFGYCALLSGCPASSQAPPLAEPRPPKTAQSQAATPSQAAATSVPASRGESSVDPGRNLPSTAADIAPEPFVVSPPKSCVDIKVAHRGAWRWQPRGDRGRRLAAKKSSGGMLGAGGFSESAVGSGGLAPGGVSSAAPAKKKPKNGGNKAPPPEPTMDMDKGPAQGAPVAKSSTKQKPAAHKMGAEAKAGSSGAKMPARGRGKKRRTVAAKPKLAPIPTTSTVKYLSADDSNSVASPAIVRKLIRLRKYVHPDYVRTYEFLNDADFDYPPPTTNEVAVYPEMRPGKAPGEYQLQIGVRALERSRENMLPLNAIFLLDISGSMAGESFALAGAFIERLVNSMRPSEKFALVAFNRKPRILLEPQLVGEHSATAVETALSAIAPTDITDFGAGIAAVYGLAANTFEEGYTNRVIVISDGASNAGKLSRQLIGKHAADMDRLGIYLAGVAVGAGFDDKLMNTVTDAGRGAYLFLDDHRAIGRVLDARRFVSTFDMAVKDVRLKMVLPPHFAVKAFHGEQISSVASEVVPQYLAPNDQMIYNMVVRTDLPESEALKSTWEFEAAYSPMLGAARVAAVKRSSAEMLAADMGIKKGGAIVRYAEMLKKIAYPLEANRESNLAKLDAALVDIAKIYDELRDSDLHDIIALIKAYRTTLAKGEASMTACDVEYDSPPVVLGIPVEHVREVIVKGPSPRRAVKALHQLRNSTRLQPIEGHRFLALGSGPIGSRYPSSTGDLSFVEYVDPIPRYMGHKRTRGRRDRDPVHDLHQVVLKLVAPSDARSFSFDFNYFSAEYPEYVKQDFNDTFYAILQAPSTNDGKTTNISFDPNHRSIEVDNNYFENDFHPIPNTGTGFDRDGSTGWLRTSWPINGGEEFTLTFSIHDEGDGIYDSIVLLDNLRFHDYDAVGNTDPLN